MKDLTYQRAAEVPRNVAAKDKWSIVGDWVVAIIACWAVITMTLAFLGIVLGDR
jgi:hypothetical protein